MLLQTENEQEIVEKIIETNPQATDVVLLLIAEHSDMDIPKLIDSLNAQNIQFVGGIFPAIIHENQHFEKGIVVKKLPLKQVSFTLTMKI